MFTSVPEHAFTVEGVNVATGVGLTVTTKLKGVPGQFVGPVTAAVTTNVTWMGALVVLVKVIAGKVDPPLVGLNPVIPEGGVTVQPMVAPGVGDTKFTAVVVPPEHTACAGTVLTPGAGLTVTVNVVDGPGQPFEAGVIVYTTLIGFAVLFSIT